MTVRFYFLLALILIALFSLPIALHAQESDASLSATIRAELKSDPRTANLSQSQLDTMVAILTQEAQKRGMTSNDIVWHPRPTTFAAEQGSGCNAGTFLCSFTNAFGFAGRDPTIPFFLGLAAMGLIWVLAEMLHKHHHGAYRGQ